MSASRIVFQTAFGSVFIESPAWVQLLDDISKMAEGDARKPMVRQARRQMRALETAFAVIHEVRFAGCLSDHLDLRFTP